MPGSVDHGEELRGALPSAAAAARLVQTLSAAERDMIVQALERAGHNQSEAARLLGLTRSQLRSRIEKHGLRAPSGGP
jgi:transcriptional regulator with GAF, ATPase, and Fis domain